MKIQIFLCALGPLMALTGSGADLYWDADGSGAGTGGTGNWLAADLWRSGSDTGTLQTWSDANDAFLGGTAGSVQIGTSGTADAKPNSLTVATSGYRVLTSNGDRVIEVSNALTLNAGVSLTFEKTSTGSARFTVGSISGATGSALELASGVSGGNVFDLLLAQSSTLSVPVSIAGSSAGMIGITSGASSVIIEGGVSNSSSASTLIRANDNTDLTLQTLGLSGSASVVFGGQGVGAGIIHLDVASTYAGNTVVDSNASGIVELGISNALPTGTALTLTQGTLDLQGFDQSVGSLSGGGGSITGTSGAELGVTGSSSTEYQGSITGGTSILKSGAGVLTLSGTSGFTGGTFVNAGTLAVNGDHSSATGTITVGNTAHFVGSGDLGGALLVKSGGTYSPGALNSVGPQSMAGDLSFESDSIFAWDLSVDNPGSDTSTTNFDSVTGSGDSSLLSGSGSIFRVVLHSGQAFSDAFWSADQSWAWTSLFSGFTEESFNLSLIFTSIESDANASTQGSFTWDTGGSNLRWNAVSPIPEPSNAVVGALIGLGLLRRRRGRGKSCRVKGCASRDFSTMRKVGWAIPAGINDIS